MKEAHVLYTHSDSCNMHRYGNELDNSNAWGYNWATLFPREINMGTCSLGLGGSQT
jgi:hypothetical protein